MGPAGISSSRALLFPLSRPVAAKSYRLERDIKLPQCGCEVFKLAKRIGSAYRQDTSLRRRQWAEACTALINRKLWVTGEFRTCQQHTSPISHPLRSSVVFYQENDARHECETLHKRRSHPDVMKLKVTLVELHLVQHQRHPLLLLF